MIRAISCVLLLRHNNEHLQQAKDIEAVKLHAVKNEQYSRKYNLKIYGINESKDESCSEKICATVKAKLDVNLERKQIATAHRIAGREGKARPLLVRLHKHDTKMEILKKRRILKGTRGHLSLLHRCDNN